MSPSWKSGSLVRIEADRTPFCVVGYDSVGSVICSPVGSGDGRDRLYVTPTLLRRIAPVDDPAVLENGTPAHATEPD